MNRYLFTGEHPVPLIYIYLRCYVMFLYRLSGTGGGTLAREFPWIGGAVYFQRRSPSILVLTTYERRHHDFNVSASHSVMRNLQSALNSRFDSLKAFLAFFCARDFPSTSGFSRTSF